ncbi:MULTISPECIES: hypothetical protein [Rhizobium]|uniref:Integrase n=1 Tax=Rhizobium favelukesii TaxID=348824 RepID=W6RSI8_9HYPH|nr:MULTISPECIES: hypothetical protein [Rhizobium]MCS0461882.1 hypothetical protein [Rhizobium favelukesii]UFS79512.1 hypothetical protein LPB79_08120 [Rhizobium sp. T136]CDM63115.1 hypothetical protein LPU83_pLPU83d_1745 [Rhizobium favelukesii]
MNPFYAEYIATAKRLAAERGLIWDLDYDDQGKVSKETRWDLIGLVGMFPPPPLYLGQVGVDPNAHEKLNEIRRRMNQSPITAGPMTLHWRELYQAVLIHQLLVRKTKPQSAFQVAQGIRRLAPAAEDTPPWAVKPEQVQQAYNAVLQSAASGKLALDFAGTLRNILDGQKLADIPSLARFCAPYPTNESLSAQQQAETVRKRQNAHGGKNGLRRSLAERKSATKLPDERAFWELVRIVFTETPRTFSDAIRFAAFRVQIIMGFRIGETALLPLDWKRWREYFDADGRPAGEHGGFSRSLMIRHFAEKQEDDERTDGVALYENTQHIPPMFEQILVETLDHIERITAPLRERLRQQTATGRIFPEYTDDALVPASEMYVRMTGNAIFTDVDLPEELVRTYRESYNPSFLAKIQDMQKGRAQRGLSAFWTNPAQEQIAVRNEAGVPFGGKIDWRTAYIRVGDVERHIRESRATKLSDTSPTRTTDGTLLYPHEMMFVVPVRNLIEGRNDGVLDTTLYSAVGRLDVGDLKNILGGYGGQTCIFARYGLTEEDRAFTMKTHALRHLQNTELFRLGVADTIITKKFNRRSVQQSHVYDHRSLAEDLANIDLPPEAEERLGNKALQVFKLISANRARGPVVDEFRKVQREYGDEAAFDYLNAEADGLHVTPYGLCMNSFTSDPCPKHLECFNGCLHLARTNVISEQENLERMRDRFAKVIITLEALPEDRRNIGWANQLTHARVRYENIVTALGTEPGMQVFPDGEDLSVTAEQKAGTTIIDTMKRLRDLDD